MNDLHELRETLHSHADLDDNASAWRAAAVHDRVRVVRRRRRAIVGGVAVAAVVAVAAGLTLPGNSEPDPADSGRLSAPSTITSTGYTYALESTRTGEHKVSVKVPKSDQPTLVAWGTESGLEDPVQVNADDGEPFTSANDAFKDFYIVYPGTRADVTVSGAEGEVSVALYSLDGTAPAGVTKAGITFRDDVGVWDLKTAEIGDRGAHELTFDLTVPDKGLVRVADLCMGLPKGYWVNLAVDGKGIQFSDHIGCDDAAYDPADGSYSVFHASGLGKPGTTVPVRMWVSRSMEGQEPVDAADLSDLRLGVAFYGVDPAYAETSMDAPAGVVESGGHTWRQTDGFGGSGTAPLVQRIAADQGHLLMVNFRTPKAVTYRISADGRELDTRRVGAGGTGEGAFGEILVPPGARELTVEVVAGGSEGTETTVGLYERGD